MLGACLIKSRLSFLLHVQLQQLPHSSASPAGRAVLATRSAAAAATYKSRVNQSLSQRAAPSIDAFNRGFYHIDLPLVASTHTVQHETGTARERESEKKSTQTGERLAKR